MVPGGHESDSDEPRPGDLTCDGPARIDLPKPRPKNAPAGKKDEPSPEPVVAHFWLNVIVRQGQPPVNGVTPPPDQLNADYLRLTLLPKPKPPEDEAPKRPEVDKETRGQGVQTAAAKPPSSPLDGDESLSDLMLRVAEATGHAVWLQSPVQGLEARGNQLVYEKRSPEQPDRIYFRGDKETRVERLNLISAGPDQGKVASIDTIRTMDVTIYQPLKPEEAATVIARGPGTLETRAARNQPIERSAFWNDRLEIQNVATSAGERRRLTLTGTPNVRSTSQGSLSCADRIVAYLKPKPAPAEVAPQDKTAQVVEKPTGQALVAPATGDALQIDWVEAIRNVELTTARPAATEPPAPGQGGQNTVRARDRLDVLFVAQEVKAPTTAKAPATEKTPAPALAARPPAAAAKTPPADPETPPAEAPPASPNSQVDAVTAWAKIAMGAPESRPELKEARLRGQVRVHQDAPPGKDKGTDVTGDAVDLIGLGPGQSWMEVHGTGTVPARAETDTFAIEGPKIGLNQQIDYAWVKGPGRLTQEARPVQAPDQAELGVKRTAFYDGPANVARAAREKSGPDQRLGGGPVEITWKQEMQFYGRPREPEYQGRAYALFLDDVKATTPESSLHCGQMKAYLDGPVSFQHAAPTTPTVAAKDANPDTDAGSKDDPPRPRIVLLHAVKDVELIHRKTDPETGALLQKGRIIGPLLQYNVLTGEFAVEGHGLVWLYKPKGENPLGAPAPNRNTATNGATVRPTAYLPAAEAAKQRGPAAPALELTRVSFQKNVRGRAGTGANPAGGAAVVSNAPFLATFQGGVQVLHAPVATERADLDPDDPPANAMFLAADQLKIVREASPAAASEGEPAPEQFFLDATGDPQAIAPPKAIRGDRITYDSVKELFYAYGSESGVSIVDQDGTGTPYSASRGNAVMYNRKTGEIQIIDPRNALILDPRSGIRATPVPPGQNLAPKPVKPPRAARPTPRSDKDKPGLQRTVAGGASDMLNKPEAPASASAFDPDKAMHSLALRAYRKAMHSLALRAYRKAMHSLALRAYWTDASSDARVPSLVILKMTLRSRE